MGQRTLIYSFVARGAETLAEYTEFTGNFTTIAFNLQKLPVTNNKLFYNCSGYSYNYLVEDGFTYCIVAAESAGRQIPMAFLERIKEEFTKKYGGGKAATAVANSLSKEFGPKLKEQMQYCVDHPEEASKISKVKAHVSEVKGVMMENIEKVLDRGKKIEPLVDKTENLHSQVLDRREKTELLVDKTENLRFKDLNSGEKTELLVDKTDNFRSQLNANSLPAVEEATAAALLSKFMVHKDTKGPVKRARENMVHKDTKKKKKLKKVNGEEMRVPVNPRISEAAGFLPKVDKSQIISEFVPKALTSMLEMGHRSLIYSSVARGTETLAEYTELTGNFTTIASEFGEYTTFTSNLTKQTATNNNVFYEKDGYTYYYLVEDGFTYCIVAAGIVALESVERLVPKAFLERIKEEFTKKYGGGKAATAVANSLSKEFGPKLKEQMQYCVDHPEEASKISKVKAHVSEVKGVMMENIEKVLDRGKKIEPLVDKTENLHSQVLDRREKTELLVDKTENLRFKDLNSGEKTELLVDKTDNVRSQILDYLTRLEKDIMKSAVAKDSFYIKHYKALTVSLLSG